MQRETNEEGRFRRLGLELEQIASEYGVDYDKVIEMFEQVCCSKKHLRLLLENKSYTKWSKLDDIGLKDESCIEYKHLLKEKGIEEIERRKKFLGI